jgi:hypothetical protein
MGDRPDEPARNQRWNWLKALLTKKRLDSNWAQMWSATFAGASVFIAIAGFITVIYQVTLLKNNAAVASARQVFMEYSKAGLKYPMFAYPDYDKLKAGDATEFNRYKLFIALMLWAYDEMLLVYDDAEWKKSFENDIDGHLQYICKEAKRDDFFALSKQMRKLLNEARARWFKNRQISGCAWD